MSTSTSTSTKAEPAPTYWLHCEEGGVTGPYTKTQARDIVKQQPGVAFKARRDGETEWKDAAVRLTPATQAQAEWQPPDVMSFMGVLLILAGLALAGYFLAIYDTGVEIASGQAVFNLDRGNTRMVGMIAGMGLLVTGAVLVGFSKMKPQGPLRK